MREEVIKIISKLDPKDALIAIDYIINVEDIAVRYAVRYDELNKEIHEGAMHD